MGITIGSMFTSCMKWDYNNNIADFNESYPGLFIVCEGNFQYGNSSLSFYNPLTNEVLNEVFFKANAMKLGDVAQSITIFEDNAWIAVNNSHVIFEINTDTFRERGRIENLSSPRYIHFLSKEKAYVTQLWDNRIFVINPQTYSITGYITVPNMDVSSGSTEQMVQLGKYVYCNCWSFQNRIIKIDSEIDQVVDELTIGIQPNSIVIDKYNRIWTITDGGFLGSPYGYENPCLYCISTESFSIEKKFSFPLGNSPSELNISGDGDYIYWINDDIWKMNVLDTTMPDSPFIPYQGTKFYGLTIDPDNDEVYVADAIDYAQQGLIYRYSSSAELIHSFYVGITPGAFAWKK